MIGLNFVVGLSSVYLNYNFKKFLYLACRSTVNAILLLLIFSASRQNKSVQFCKDA